jgi:hypothetical protein
VQPRYRHASVERIRQVRPRPNGTGSPVRRILARLSPTPALNVSARSCTSCGSTARSSVLGTPAGGVIGPRHLIFLIRFPARFRPSNRTTRSITLRSRTSSSRTVACAKVQTRRGSSWPRRGRRKQVLLHRFRPRTCRSLVVSEGLNRIDRNSRNFASEVWRREWDSSAFALRATARSHPISDGIAP